MICDLKPPRSLAVEADVVLSLGLQSNGEHFVIMENSECRFGLVFGHLSAYNSLSYFSCCEQALVHDV
jgi:hypothetical protein